MAVEIVPGPAAKVVTSSADHVRLPTATLAGTRCPVERLQEALLPYASAALPTCSPGISGPDDEVVTYCRLSHRSSRAWFAMAEIAGMAKARV